MAAVKQAQARRGMFYGWVIVGVAVLSQVAAGPAQVSVLTVFMGPMGQELGWPRTALSAMVSAGTVLSALLVMAGGPVLDRYGPRYVMLGIGVMASLGCLGMALLTTPALFVLAFLMVRTVGVGLVIVAATTAVANWFVRKRGRATGVTTIGIAAGIAILAPLSQALLGTFDWRTIWLFFAAFTAVVYFGGGLLLERRPEDRGLLPDGDLLPSATGATDRGGAAPSPALVEEPSWTRQQAMRTAAFWVLTLTMAAAALVAAGVSLHQVPFLLDRGMAPTAAAATVGVYALSLGAGNLLGGFLAERLPLRPSLAGCFLVVAVGLLALVWLPLPQGPVAYAVLAGTAQGVRAAMEPVMWADHYGRANLGAIRGASYGFFVLGLAVGPVLAGATYDLLGSYVQLYLGLVAVSVVGAVAILYARAPRRPAPV